MKPFVRRLALVCVVGVSLIVTAPVVHAVENASFGVTPYPETFDGAERSSFAVPLETGATFEDAVRVYNRTDQALTLAIYAADADVASDNQVTVHLHSDTPKGVGSWIELSKSSVALQPRGEVVVGFKISIRTADPSPARGAIVVENTTKGVSAKAAQPLRILVLTNPANTATTSVRIRPLLLRSPWIIIALVALVAALALVWVGARRARRPKDKVLPAGGLQSDADDPAPIASRPVIRRLGEPPRDESSARTRRIATRTRPGTATTDERPLLTDDLLVEVDEDENDVRELESDDIDEDDIEIFDDAHDADDQDLDENDLPPARPRRKPSAAKTQTKRTASSDRRSSASRRQPAKKARSNGTANKKRNFIPLDDL